MIERAMLTEGKRRIDLREIVQAAGADLQTAGPGRFRCRCPLHEERTPSFFIYTDQGRWYCFGCGEGGDGIDLVRRLRGCSFREACAVIGFDNPQRSAAELGRIRAERREREAVKWRERDLAWLLRKLIRFCHKALERITPENFDSPEFALILDQISILEHQHEALTDGDPADRAGVLRDWQGARLPRRRLLFKKEFDYVGWLRSIQGRARDQRCRKS